MVGLFSGLAFCILVGLLMDAVVSVFADLRRGL